MPLRRDALATPNPVISVAVIEKLAAATPTTKVLPVRLTSMVAPFRFPEFSPAGIDDTAAVLPMTAWLAWLVKAVWLRSTVPRSMVRQRGPPIEFAGMEMPSVSMSSRVTV